MISGVDALVARGHADPGRVGAMGWSHGGYLAQYLGACTDRFQAVSAGAGVSDWTTYYTNSDDRSGWAVEYLGARPWDDPAVYRRTAPLSCVTSARTPTLLQHGELDRRAPIAGSYELYRALRDRGVPVRMIVYQGAGHGGRSFTPRQYRALLEHNEEWFVRWILR